MTVYVDMPEVQAALDAESFEWLDDNIPMLARAVAEQVARKHSPEQIGRFVMRSTQRAALAARVEQAARHLARGAA